MRKLQFKKTPNFPLLALFVGSFPAQMSSNSEKAHKEYVTPWDLSR